jgi:Zn-dependent protease
MLDNPLPLLACIVIVWLTFSVLRGGFAVKSGQTQTNTSGNALVLAILSVVAAVLLLGPVRGIAVVVGIAIHEFGHVAAYRAMGHNDARFRMVPLLGGVAISGKLPKTQLADYYIAIMGPGIMLPVLVVSGIASQLLIPYSFTLATWAYAMFLITGLINFFNLLPLWPLDGGRILRTLTYSWSPLASRYITLAMSIGLAIWAFYAQHILIFLVALFGFSSARRIAVINRAQPPMTSSQSLIATIAYLSALAAHGLAGWPLVQQILLR